MLSACVVCVEGVRGFCKLQAVIYVSLHGSFLVAWDLEMYGVLSTPGDVKSVNLYFLSNFFKDSLHLQLVKVLPFPVINFSCRLWSSSYPGRKLDACKAWEKLLT